MSNQTSTNSSIPDFWAQKPIHEPRHMKIICIGAGASGLLMAYKLQRSFDNFDLTLYEKNEEVSGTWLENTYPGCACDIPAHIYTYSFEPKSDWSAVYSGSGQIREYFQDFAKKYDLYKFIKTSHQVSAAVWNDKNGEWDVEITSLEDGSMIKDSCHILVNACGFLNAWKWPAIPGLSDYKGLLLHTAKWDSSVDLNGKHVGLIGNGSSAIQVLPAISETVSKITTFIRGPTWVSPSLSIESRHYSDEEKEKFAEDPQAHLEYRKQLESSINAVFPLFIAGSTPQTVTSGAIAKLMQEKLQNDDLAKVLIPPFPIGCRRFTPGIGYLEALATDKVDMVYGEIDKITERGCLSANGQEYPVDVLICATGFDTTYRPRFPVIGESGQSLAQAWDYEPRSYLGLATNDFPNYFMLVGPNTPVGNGPVLSGLESQVDYILKLVNRWQSENIRSLAPKAEAVEDFIAFKDQFMKKTVWDSDCRSWYKGNSKSGKVTAVWPGSTLHYIEAIAEPRYEDWDIKYSGNRFAFLGNGFSQVESDKTADWAYYIRNEDDSPYLGRAKNRKVYSKSGTIVREDNGGVTTGI